MKEEIFKLLSEGLSNKEISEALDLTLFAVGVIIKEEGFVRTKDQEKEIKRRCRERGKSKYKQTNVKYPKTAKNYLTDNLYSFLDSGDQEKDVFDSLKSIQKLRNKNNYQSYNNEKI